jgi:polysaccharide biosynthesis/export protein
VRHLIFAPIDVPPTTIVAMQHPYIKRGSGFPLLSATLALLILGSGCAQRAYRAANLPRELMAPSTLDPQCINLSGLADQSVSAEVIQPGDVLEVTMITDYTKLTTTAAPVRVADDGSIAVPLVGRVGVGGLEVKQAEQAVNAESVARGVFRTPCITMTMKQCHTSRVTVVGAVNSPGVHDLPRGSTSLMAALLAAGGLGKEAGTEVEIRHTDSRQAPQESIRVDLAAAAAGALRLPELRDGDVVQVTKRTLPPVYVIGLVRKPGEFPFPPNQELRVLDALALAGGVSNSAAEDVLLIRHPPGAAEPVRIAVSIQAAKNGRDNLALAPGDTVSVEQTPVTVVVDTIQTFFRVSLGGSMTWF